MRRRKTGRLKLLLAASVLFIVSAVIVLSYGLQRAAVTPRALGPYVEHRTQGHNPMIEKTGQTVAAVLTSLDRGDGDDPYVFPALKIGAQATAADAVSAASGKPVYVASAAEATRAIAQARPGDVISFLPGTYRFEGQGSIKVTQAGSAAQRITVTAERPGTVILEFNMVEGFRVAAPYWTFENLTIKGICANHSDCEHAFHVVGRAAHFIARNNTITDFNAQFKINGEDGFMPDDGLIESNSLSNSSVRNTANPVTMMDMVAASRWVIRRNLITDFIKGDGNKVSYGAFAKGAGIDNRFEENIVICEHRLKGLPGARVGLSFGGGGTGKEYCRDKRCITEHERGTMQANLIMSCSDEGIYINRSATSKLIHNTLVDTSGIAVRFPESSADLEGNLVDGRILGRDGGILRGEDNIETSVASLYIGRHGVRQLFAGASHLDFAWASTPPRRKAAQPGILDLCGGPRPGQPPPVYGAFEDFSGCYPAAPAKPPLNAAR
ncbi:right-handed parallel beta-helix repeat-containing protein [Undibacterium sp. TJN25]|uniref:right-handed parallel beta-helix repeat-containing protein n=1 Tax=Undibacterium sp. TJN25 TaxID=3413056 RepID=UPI003BF1683E